MSTALNPARILETGLAFWSSKALLSAIELGLFSELAKGPANEPALRDRLGLHRRGAGDFLDALVALGFLEREAGSYSNAPETDAFLDRAKPTYLGGMLEMANHRLYPSWGRLTQALRSGLPQNGWRSDGAGFFETVYADPPALKAFLSAMTDLSRGAHLAIARQFSWRRCRTFVDVGTAQGDLAVQIAKAHPGLRGVGFDLPAVAPVFEQYASDCGVADRLSFASGDFFNQELPKADVVLMGHVLHDWDLEQKRALIGKAYDALPRGGALIVCETLIDDQRSTHAFGLLMSLNMLVETPGGFDYTGADCCGWMRAAGFTATRVERLAGPDSMVVAIK